jgi:hypothetical protein
VLFGRKQQEAAQAAVEAARKTIAAVQEGGLDPDAAEAMLARAEELVAARDYEEAERRARRAGRLAEALREHAPKVEQQLLAAEASRDELRQSGIDIRDVAEEERIREVLAKGFVKVKGKVLTGPEFAAKLAARLARRYAGRVAAHSEANKAVTAAAATLQHEVSSKSHVSAEVLKRGAWHGAFDALEKAQAAFAKAEFEEARDFADWAVAVSKEMRERFEPLLADYEVAEAAYEKLVADGISAHAMMPALLRARDLIQSGELEPARERAREARQESERLRSAHGAASLALKKAEETIQEVAGWGFRSVLAASKVEEARRLLREGEFDSAARVAEEARATASSLRETHRATAERIGAARREMESLPGADPEEAERVESLLQEAERDLEEGNYKGCEQNLELATFMLDELKRAA